MVHNFLVSSSNSSHKNTDSSTKQQVHITRNLMVWQRKRTVQTAKNLIKKVILDKRDPYLALLEYRNTPISNTLGSPAQRLIGWRTKTLLPTNNKLLQPKIIKPQTVLKEFRDRKAQQKFYYDRHTVDLRPLALGDKVMMRGKIPSYNYDPYFTVNKDHSYRK